MLTREDDELGSTSSLHCSTTASVVCTSSGRTGPLNGVWRTQKSTHGNGVGIGGDRNKRDSVETSKLASSLRALLKMVYQSLPCPPQQEQNPKPLSSIKRTLRT